jgi:hypothetical protein
MGVARLSADTGERLEIRFGISWLATPGGGGVSSTRATDILVTLMIPSDRPPPDSALVLLYGLDVYGSGREFLMTLKPDHDDGGSDESTYSGRIPDEILIATAGPGEALHSMEQGVEVLLAFGASRVPLNDPINGTPRFQVSLDMAQLAD